MHLFRGILILTTVATVFFACSTPSATTGVTEESEPSIFPSWYAASGFAADSSSFSVFATAIDADSLAALSGAEEQARIILFRELGERIEDIRSSLEESGNADVKNTDYYIILIEAQESLPAKAVQSSVVQRLEENNNTYRAFISLKLDKKEAREQLENGFNGHPRYWGALSGSEAFSRLFN